MEKHLNKRTITVGFVLTVLLFAVFSIVSYEKLNHLVVHPAALAVPQKQTNYFSYFGKNGQNALTLLQEQTAVAEDHSGLVVSIDGHKANAAAHEYWAFYVNNKMADVGPAAYVTKDTDKIEWKIEKY